jgi:hypothetical protein
VRLREVLGGHACGVLEHDLLVGVERASDVRRRVRRRRSRGDEERADEIERFISPLARGISVTFKLIDDVQQLEEPVSRIGSSSFDTTGGHIAGKLEPDLIERLGTRLGTGMRLGKPIECLDAGQHGLGHIVLNDVDFREQRRFGSGVLRHERTLALEPIIGPVRICHSSSFTERANRAASSRPNAGSIARADVTIPLSVST